VAVIGIGRDFGGDDTVGLVVARRLETRLPENAAVVEMTGDMTALIDHFDGAETVILVDAVESGSRPGKIHRIDGNTLDTLRSFPCRTTHDMDLVKTVELLWTLGQIPARLVIFGVEGENFSRGAEISPEVERAIPDVVNRILEEI